MNQIVLSDWNLGGVSDSVFSGQKGSQAAIVGLDLHRKPGAVQAAQKMVKNSGVIVDELCKYSFACSDGNSYWGSSTSGKIYKRTEAGSWSLLTTLEPEAGSAGICGMAEFGDSVYIATESRLHRVLSVNMATFASPDIDWAAFTVTNPEFHQMYEVNGVLYICDGYLIAQVDETGTFTADGLDLPKNFVSTCLGRLGTDLLIGSKGKSSAVALARVFRWNTWSISWTDDVVVSEKGVNAILMLNEAVIVSCGTQGNLYQYTGSLTPFKKVPGAYSPTATSTIHPQSYINRNGSILFGFSNVQNNPSKHAIWQMGRYNIQYPLVLSTDYPISTGSVSNVEIGALLQIGDDVFASWKDSTGVAAFGVDKLDYGQRFNNGYIETMAIAFNRSELKQFGNIAADLAAPLSDGCSLSFSYKRQDDADWSGPGEMVEAYDDKRVTYSIGQGVEAATMQLRIEFTTSENLTPELFDIVITQS